MQCYIYPDVIGSELNLEVAFHHIYEFRLPLNQRIVHLKTAKEVRWNFPRVVSDNTGVLNVLCFNRIFAIQLHSLLNILNGKDLTQLNSYIPRVNLFF